MPAPAAVIDETDGLCCDELKLLGPLQLQVFTPLPLPLRVTLSPTQAGFGEAVAVTPDTPGDTVTAKLWPLLPQVLEADTETVYGPPAVVQFTLMDVEPCPLVIVPPPETLQV